MDVAYIELAMRDCSFLVTGQIEINTSNYMDLKIKNQSQQKSHAGAPLRCQMQNYF
jgi:hypothetical protein